MLDEEDIRDALTRYITFRWNELHMNRHELFWSIVLYPIGLVVCLILLLVIWHVTRGKKDS